MCKYLTKKGKSSCQQIRPAGQDLEINRFFFAVKFKNLLPQEFSVDMYRRTAPS